MSKYSHLYDQYSGRLLPVDYPKTYGYEDDNICKPDELEEGEEQEEHPEITAIFNYYKQKGQK